MYAVDPEVFGRIGAHLVAGALDEDLAGVLAVMDSIPPHQAGVRIREVAGLRRFLSPEGSIGAVAAAVLGRDAKPVRAVLFDKTAERNWALGWHQDRTICVREPREVNGFGPWTVKHGMHHVAPPFELLAGMVTLRAHLDDVPAENAPLLIAPGSHRLGRVPVREVEDVVARCGTVVCLAQAGDVWLYSTPILHASAAAIVAKRRRVLQVDYAAEDLPGGLAWLGV